MTKLFYWVQPAAGILAGAFVVFYAVGIVVDYRITFGLASLFIAFAILPGVIFSLAVNQRMLSWRRPRVVNTREGVLFLIQFALVALVIQQAFVEVTFWPLFIAVAMIVVAIVTTIRLRRQPESARVRS